MDILTSIEEEEVKTLTTDDSDEEKTSDSYDTTEDILEEKICSIEIFKSSLT